MTTLTDSERNNIMGNSIKVAGVTFANPDGENRQNILRDFGYGYRYAILKQTVFDGERAVEVWVDSKLIGYVPKKELDNPLSFSPILLAQICCFEEDDLHYVILSEIIPPTDETLSSTRTFCEQHSLPMPSIQDERAFALYPYQYETACITA